MMPVRELSVNNIVVIDDDPNMIDILSQYADITGAKTLAYSGPDDLDVDALTYSDLIFLDLLLQFHDGLDILKLMHDHNVQTPVVIFSGMDDGIISSTQDLLSDYGLQYAGTLTKPFTLAQFESVINFSSQGSCPKQLDGQPSVAKLNEEDISYALKNSGIEVVYQPQIDTVQNRYVGIECLARLRHPTLGLCLPNQFIDVVNESGQMEALTKVVIKQALDSLRNTRLPEKSIISFNVAPENLSLMFVAWLLDCTMDYGIEPSKISLEITEMSALELNKEVRTILTKLRIRGFNISLDDFGTGYSTIQELNELPFNELKIDRSFIMTLDEKETSNAIVQYTIDLASKLDYRLVAEGVETRQQMEKLQAMGCSNMQGFLFSRPISLDKLESFIAQTQGSNSIFPLWQSSQKQPS